MSHGHDFCLPVYDHTEITECWGMVQLAACLDCYGAGDHLSANPFRYALQNLTVCRREYYCHAIQSGGWKFPESKLTVWTALHCKDVASHKLCFSDRLSLFLSHGGVAGREVEMSACVSCSGQVAGR